ncbi:NAD-dependent epimerase/dehydratase family protein [Nocardia sp. XZ_19_231]|uniref:NAD-dependent epimerase/dehydratase family protein n=1 Tax=Nocardia sp. XZ_19_231 TaxID=2769252 RepID=UPI00188F02F2|nr:NAD-dependent epimerase/dehydratase family protein [Nocardia sp. XZ_19_231]
MHTVITGGAGLIGSHLARKLAARGDKVTVIDNLSTGFRANLVETEFNPNVTLRIADVTDRSAFDDLGDVDSIVHLACPAAPAMYMSMPIETLRAGSAGSMNALTCAAATGARIILASSSDVYGDTAEHPQVESSRGAIDPIGPRSAYEVAKMFTEAAAVNFHRAQNVRAGVIRPFNVYGPGMWVGDSRVVPAFCSAALAGETLHLHGGTQTRSLLYVDDAVTAICSMLEHDTFGPVNVGSEEEVSILDLANKIIELAGSGSVEVTEGRAQDAPSRCPDMCRADVVLNWQARVSLDEGLARTLDWMRAHRAGPAAFEVAA